MGKFIYILGNKKLLPPIEELHQATIWVNIRAVKFIIQEKLFFKFYRFFKKYSDKHDMASLEATLETIKMLETKKKEINK